MPSTHIHTHTWRPEDNLKISSLILWVLSTLVVCSFVDSLSVAWNSLNRLGQLATESQGFTCPHLPSPDHLHSTILMYVCLSDHCQPLPAPTFTTPTYLVLRARRGDTKEEGRYCAKGARKAGRDAVHQREEGDCEERAGVSTKGSGSGARKSDPQ